VPVGGRHGSDRTSLFISCSFVITSLIYDVCRVQKEHTCLGTHHRTLQEQSSSIPSTWQSVMTRQAPSLSVHQAPDLLSWRLFVYTVAHIRSVWYKMPTFCRPTLTTLQSLPSSSALLHATRRDMDRRRKSDGSRVTDVVLCLYRA